MSHRSKPCASRRSLAEILEADETDDRLDWLRAEGPDPKDERNAGAPCFEEHRIEEKGCKSRNQHAMTLKCQTCHLRMLYVPAMGRTGEFRKNTPLEFTARRSEDIKHEKTEPSGSRPPRPTTSRNMEKPGNPADLNWKRFMDHKGNPQAENGSKAPGKEAKEYSLRRRAPAMGRRSGDVGDAPARRP